MSSQVLKFSQESMREFEGMGWKSISHSKANRFCGTGELYKYQREISTCETLFGGLLFVLSLPLCCCFGQSIPMCERVSKGVEEQEVFCRDEAKSDELVKADYKALGFDPNDKKSMRAFVERQAADDNTPLLSVTVRGFKYLAFYGPVSKFSYVMLIPNGNLDACECHSYCSAITGEAFSASALSDWAEKLCAAWRPDAAIGRIDRIASKTLIGEIEAPSGSAELYACKEQLLVQYDA